jgi:hypothetical protein
MTIVGGRVVHDTAAIATGVDRLGRDHGGRDHGGRGSRREGITTITTGRDRDRRE